MAIEFVCPACRGTLSVADDAVGRVVRCGSCMTTLRVPVPAADSGPADEPAPPRSPKPARLEKPLPPGDTDEHGEPRRRGAKKRTSGRSPLFWLLAIASVLGLLTCLACGGIVLVLASPHWHTHEPAGGGYKVDLPAPINPQVAQQAKLKLKANESVEGTMLVGRLELYMIWHTDFDLKGQPFNPDDILKATLVQFKKDTPGTLVRETTKKVDGCPATEVVITNQQGETHHCLIVVASSRVYVAAAGGPFVTPDGNQRIRKFLDSFHLVEGGNPWRGKVAPKKDN